jgi:hypothetical protein
MEADDDGVTLTVLVAGLTVWISGEDVLAAKFVSPL